MSTGVAERGLKFVVSTDVSSDLLKPFEIMDQHVAALEKRLKGLTIPAPKIAGATRLASVAGPAAVSSPAGTDAGISKLEAAEKASLRRRLDARREFEEKLRVGAEKAAAENEKFNRQMLDQQIKDLKKAEADKDKILADSAARRVAEAKREQKADQAFWSDFERFGENRAKAKRDSDRKLAREKKAAEAEVKLAEGRAAEAQSKMETAVWGTVHGFGALTRAAAQFSLIGQQDMMKVLDTVWAIEGAINSVQGGLDAFQAVRGLSGALGAAGGASGAARAIHAAGSVAGGAAVGGGLAFRAGQFARQVPGMLSRAAPIAATGAAVAGVGALAIGAAGVIQRHGTAGERYDRGERGYMGQSKLAHWFQVQSEGGVIAGIAHRYVHGHGIGEQGMKTQDELDAEHAKRQQAFDIARERRAQQERSQVEAFQQRFGVAQSQFSRFTSLHDQMGALGATGDAMKDIPAELSRVRNAIGQAQQMRTMADLEARAAVGPQGEGRGGQRELQALQAVKTANDQIIDLQMREGELAKQQRLAAIDGLRQQLDLQRQATAATRAASKNLGAQYQGEKKGLGAMTPEDLKRTAELQQKIRGQEKLGEEVPRRSGRLGQPVESDLDFALRSPVREVREAAERQLEQRGQQQASMFGIDLSPSRDLAHQSRMKLREQERKEHGLESTVEGATGRTLDVKLDANVQHKFEVELEAADHLASEVAGKIKVQIAATMQDMSENWAEKIMEQVRAEISERARRQNQDGRQAWGG